MLDFLQEEFDTKGVIRIGEGQTTQLPKEKGQKDKQRSTKHNTYISRSSNTNPTNNRG